MANCPDSGIDSETIETLTDAKFRQNLQEMRSSGDMCDITLVVEGTSFKAHRLILASCSPYFRCMFGQKKFTEADMESVSIDPEGQIGIKAQAVGILIDYMYSGYIDMSQGEIIDIIWAADLLQLPDIKEQGLDRLEDFIDFTVSFPKIDHYVMGLEPNWKKIPQNSGKQIRIPEGM